MTRKIGIQFDENGDFVGDFLEGMELPEGHTLYTGEIPEGLYMPKLIDGAVVEGLTQEEIDAIRNAPRLETAEEKIMRLEDENAFLALELATAHAQIAQNEQGQADLILELVQKGVL